MRNRHTFLRFRSPSEAVLAVYAAERDWFVDLLVLALKAQRHGQRDTTAAIGLAAKKLCNMYSFQNLSFELNDATESTYAPLVAACLPEALEKVHDDDPRNWDTSRRRSRLEH